MHRAHRRNRMPIAINTTNYGQKPHAHAINTTTATTTTNNNENQQCHKQPT